MMIKKNIVLIGFMGCGKTTVGKKLANVLKVDFYDTDEIIEEKTKMSISEIFTEYGEDNFRQREATVIESLCERKGVIISTGGGVVIKPYNMKLLKKNGVIIWLKASLESILQRLKDNTSRPLLYKKDFNKINELYNMRNRLYYYYSDICIDTNGKNIKDIALEIYKKAILI